MRADLGSDDVQLFADVAKNGVKFVLGNNLSDDGKNFKLLRVSLIDFLLHYSIPLTLCHAVSEGENFLTKLAPLHGALSVHLHLLI